MGLKKGKKVNIVNALAFKELVSVKPSGNIMGLSKLFCLGYMSDKTLIEITREHWFKKSFLDTLTILVKKHIPYVFETQYSCDIMKLLNNPPMVNSIVADSEDDVRSKMADIYIKLFGFEFAEGMSEEWDDDMSEPEIIKEIAKESEKSSESEESSLSSEEYLIKKYEKTPPFQSKKCCVAS